MVTVVTTLTESGAGRCLVANVVANVVAKVYHCNCNYYSFIVIAVARKECKTLFLIPLRTVIILLINVVFLRSLENKKN